MLETKNIREVLELMLSTYSAVPLLEWDKITTALSDPEKIEEELEIMKEIFR